MLPTLGMKSLHKFFLSGDHRSQITQFCGHDPECRKFENPIALQMAKANIDKYFPVVGITELMNEVSYLTERIFFRDINNHIKRS